MEGCPWELLRPSGGGPRRLRSICHHQPPLATPLRHPHHASNAPPSTPVNNPRDPPTLQTPRPLRLPGAPAGGRDGSARFPLPASTADPASSDGRLGDLQDLVGTCPPDPPKRGRNPVGAPRPGRPGYAVKTIIDLALTQPKPFERLGFDSSLAISMSWLRINHNRQNLAPTRPQPSECHGSNSTPAVSMSWLLLNPNHIHLALAQPKPFGRLGFNST